MEVVAIVSVFGVLLAVVLLVLLSNISYKLGRLVVLSERIAAAVAPTAQPWPQGPPPHGAPPPGP